MLGLFAASVCCYRYPFLLTNREVTFDSDEFKAKLPANDGEYKIGLPARPGARMPPMTAFFFGVWYSIILAAAMTAGVKYLHPATASAHGLIQSIAWALGSGIAIALACRLSRSHKMAVGILSTLVSASAWIVLLLIVQGDPNVETGDSIFGKPLTVETYVSVLVVLILSVGLISSFLSAKSRDDEKLSVHLLSIPPGHWFWLWIAGFAWVSMFPVVAYYFWLQIVTALYSLVHPSLWLQVGSGIFFGILGVAALLKGIELSLHAVSDKSSYGAPVWKRVAMFVVGTVLLASIASPFLLNVDIDRMKDMPASLGVHPWWVL